MSRILATSGSRLQGEVTQHRPSSCTGGEFKQKKAVLVRLKKDANLLKVTVPSIKKEKGMDLRGVTVKPVR